MGHDRCALKQERTAACAPALAAMFLLAACIGCGVRADQNLSHAPLPICDNTGVAACQTLENRASFAAPSWLVRCRREWSHWRHGQASPVEREAIVIPPAPRFHPVPTRPVFAPLEYEAPAGAEIQEQQTPPAPVPPKPQMKFPAEEVPGPVEAQPSEAAPAPQAPPTSAKNDLTASPETSAIAPKLLPRVLLPKAQPSPSLTPPLRSAAKPKQQISKIPDAPLATEPLAESIPSPDWKPRR